MALVGFIAAFALGVAFPVAEVGFLEKDWPAWEAGLREGDRIVRLGSMDAPDFKAVRTKLALSRGPVLLKVVRGTETFQFEVQPRYGTARIPVGRKRQNVLAGMAIRQHDLVAAAFGK